MVYAFCRYAPSFSCPSWLITSSPIDSSGEQKGHESADGDEESGEQEDDHDASLKGAGEGRMHHLLTGMIRAVE